MLMPPPFGADTLTCALVLAHTATPTPTELSAALRELYPGGNGPSVADVLDAGWLVPTVDKKRLREPPMSLKEQDVRLAEAVLPANNRHFHTGALVDNGQVKGTVPPTQVPTAGITCEQTAPRFSYYRGGIANTTPYAAITPAQLYKVLTSSQHRAPTEALRAAPAGSSQRVNLKRGLDYVTPAGIFARRANTALKTSSGLLVLDFDHVPDLSTARAALLADALVATELVLLFTSPSGDGLKALVKADPDAGHLDNFSAYADYLAARYGPLGLCPDKAGKDVARACFVPYAPDAWLAPDYASTAENLQ